MKYGIIAVQEPWAGNPYQHTTHNPVKNVFHLLYPPETGEQELPPRVCMFVNKDIASASWKVTFHSPDLMTLHLEFPGETQRVINLHNIYKPSPSQENYSTLSDLIKALEVEGEHIVVGDFNLHHPLLTGEDYHHQHPEADQLLEILDQSELELLLPPGTITYDHRSAQITIDVTFATPAVASAVLMCDVRREIDSDSC